MKRSRSGIPWEYSGLFQVMIILYDAEKPMTAKQVDNAILNLNSYELSESYAGVALIDLRSRNIVRLAKTEECCPNCGRRGYRKYELTSEGKEAVQTFKKRKNERITRPATHQA